MVIFYNAGEQNQSFQKRKDSHSNHFIVYPSAIAFGDNGEWVSVQEIQNSTQSTTTFMGPSLWLQDTAIYARVFQSNWASGTPLGSHIDMLHQSPFAMGAAFDSASAYWVFDGHNGTICKYDFAGNHGPGYEYHDDGVIWRYTDVTVTREPNVPSHMVLDRETGWLYFIDGGARQLKRLNTNTGTIAGNLNPPASGM
jgi:hypothetical protein